VSSPAQIFSANLLATLVDAGVEHIYLAPGSRSQSLAIAADQLARAGRVKLHVRIDERSMAFTALGTALASGNPVALITTSGTAVANLHPAVLEAHHAGIPLLLLTADRPDELRGVGANQTTDQIGLFGSAVQHVFDVEAPVADEDEAHSAQELASAALELIANQPGPIQLNLAFREPLSSSTPDASTIFVEPTEPVIGYDPIFAVLSAEPKTIVIAGAGAGEAAVELAESFGWPIFAEPSSLARYGANAIANYRRLLENNHELASEIERVIVFGKPTLSRKIQAMFYNEAIETVVVRSKSHGVFDVAKRASQIVDEISVEDEVDFDWLTAWRIVDKEFEVSITTELTRANIIHEIYSATADGDCLVLGASRMIRVADEFAPVKPVAVFSNRGLAGIDGTISTATGVALAYPNDGGFTRALMGDLTALHDVGGLSIDPMDGALNLQIVVVNDGGGSIFEGLEVAKEKESFDRVFRTKQKVDFWHLAEAYGWQYLRVERLEQLAPALQTTGRVMIEIALG
jgi:2-succinyl-5-enolpyruvyl-6-hydroxy-3-cyclohexene-1-carboxylate synthase